MCKNARRVLDDIVELSADDADILLIGYHDPFSRLRLIPDTAHSLVMDMVGLTMQSLNDFLANLALEYDNVFFVPILGASSFCDEGESVFEIIDGEDNITDAILMALHPDAAGHEFIAGRVMEKLNEINVCRHEHTKTVPPKYLGLCVCRYSGALVCADCGKTLDAGSVITPCARIPIPEISINYLAQTVENTIAAKISRVRSRILSSCAVLTSVLC